MQIMTVESTEISRPSPTQVLVDLKSRESPILALLRPEELDVISRTSAVHVLQPNHVFMSQGDNSSSMFIILSGYAVISVDSSGMNDLDKAKQVDTVRTVVGEVGMLTGQRREAFGQAGPDGCVLLELTISELKSLSLKRLQLRAKLISLMAKAKKEKFLNLVELTTQTKHPSNPCNFLSQPDTGQTRDKLKETRLDPKQRLVKVVSIAEGVRATIRTLERQEEAAIQAVLSKADNWILENLHVEEEYEVRPLISFLDQHPLSKRMFIAGAGVGLLHKAAWTGHKLICSQLLKCGCPLDMIDSQHKNVLHHVVHGANLSPRDHFETMRMFLARGATLIRDCDGNSPLDLSKRDDMSLLLSLHLRESQLASCQLPQCSLKPLVLCSNCRLAKYCCLEHLRSDLAQHMQVCARACPSSRALLSRAAAESIAVAHLRVNITSLEQDWQVRKAHGLSMAAFVVRQKLRVHFARWDRYRWMVRARLSVTFTRAMGLPAHRGVRPDRGPLGAGSGVDGAGFGAPAEAEPAASGAAPPTEAEFAAMSLDRLRRLCLPNYREVRGRLGTRQAAARTAAPDGDPAGVT